MELHGRRLVVRPWRTADLTALVRHADNPNVARQLRDRFPHPYTTADARSFLAWSRSPSGHPPNLAIEVDAQAVGGIGYSRGSDIERYSAEVGYWLGEPYWGRGLATEALVLLTEHLFRHRNLLRLFAVPLADNAASLRVLEKAGYVREARLHASCVKHGAVKDQILFARVNEAWKGVTE